MYTNPSRQVTFEDFEQPLGMSLTKDNQWVKQASLIPWDKLEALYAKCFPSRTGTAAKSVRLMFGAVLIQQRYDLSDREVVGMIQENPYLQYFCGLSGYDSSKPPFDPSSLVHFRKRLGENHLMEQYGELVVASCRSAIKSRKKDKNSGTPPDRPSGGNAAADPPASSSESETAAPVKAVEAGGTAETANPASSKNAGTLILDATCAPQNIRFPQDTSLLNEAREKADNLIDELFSQVRQPGEKRPRTYRETAAKEHQGFSMKRRHTAKDIRRHVGHQLKQLKRNLKCVDDLLARGAKLPEKAAALLEVLKLVHDQQEEMYRTRTHRVADRIVSIAQPWIRPIVRGKTKTPTEFGPKVHLSISDGFVRVEQCEYAAFNESTCLQECVERFHEREGHWPERVLADRIYRTRGNLRFCKEHGIRLLGPKLGRKADDPEREKAERKLTHQDGIDRIEIERTISQGKRCCGLGLLFTKLQETTFAVVGVAATLLNLQSTMRVLYC